MTDIFALEPHTQILQTSYILSYPHLLSYFGKDVFDAVDIVRGTHMVYGWMPTVLEFYPGTNLGFDRAAELLTQARRSGTLSDRDLTALQGLINNSLVGVSKLLHFVAPTHFAMWDSKIYTFVFEEQPHNYRVNKVEKYCDYLKKLTELQSHSRFARFHDSVNAKVGYEVSKLHALELVMFLNAPREETAGAAL